MPTETVLNYELRDKLGSGGMGDVYRAFDKRLNRFVAIKVLAPGKSGNPERRRRFLQEAQAASALNHPNIITIHDILQENDKQFIVMEHVTGRTLLDLIPAGGLPVPDVLHYAAQMADALSTAHAAGIIHRDFKPANVMVTASGRIKVLDFGLAKLEDQSASFSTSMAAGAAVGSGGSQGSFPDMATMTNVPLTAEGSILGTVNYMSPEQAEGKRVDSRSDIFSFGAVLYEMLTGNRAFQGESEISTLTAVLRDQVKPISRSGLDVPLDLENVVVRCLQKDPTARWQSMKDVESALSALKRRSDSLVVESSAVQAKKADAKTTRIPRKVLALTGAVVALLVAVSAAGWWWMNRQKPAATPVAQLSTPPPPVAPNPIAPTPAAPTPEAATPPAIVPAPTAPPPKSAAAGPSKPAPVPKNTTAPVRDDLGTGATPAQPSTVPKKAQSKPTAPPAPVETVSVILSDALPFRIALAEDVPADAPGGQDLTFRVLEDFKIGDVIVFAKGAAVTGSIVAEAGKKNFLGKGGKMTYRLASAQAVDGSKISVRAAAARNTPNRPLDTGRYAKPKDVAAASGTDYIAYVDGEQTVSIRK